uniref:Uncharacterized protein n=1 Tax=Rhizophora mucronata TaxID=61149 RepID=A0A2P2IX60_RHIMU
MLIKITSKILRRKAYLTEDNLL